MAGYLFNYEDKVWGGEILRLNPFHFRALRLKYLLNALKDTKGKLLDVGCATGDFLEAIKYYRPDLEIYGVDISKKAVNIANKRVKGASFKVANGEKLPYRDNFFDAVICFDVLEHLEYPEIGIKEANRVLKKGGIYQIFIPTEGNLSNLEGILIKLGWKAKEKYGAHPTHFTSSKVKQMLRNGKFKIAKKRWGDHLFHQLLEISYFTFLSLRGKNLGQSVEGYLSTDKGLKIKILRIIKYGLATVSYFESSVFWFIPGVGIHITSTKNGK